MRVVYDRSSDSAYIYLVHIPPGGATKMYACPPADVGGMINLDFDKDGRLIGIEVLDARRYLPAEVLANADDIRI